MCALWITKPEAVENEAPVELRMPKIHRSDVYPAQCSSHDRRRVAARRLDADEVRFGFTRPFCRRRIPRSRSVCHTDHRSVTPASRSKSAVHFVQLSCRRHFSGVAPRAPPSPRPASPSGPFAHYPSPSLHRSLFSQPFPTPPGAHKHHPAQHSPDGHRSGFERGAEHVEGGRGGGAAPSAHFPALFAFFPKMMNHAYRRSRCLSMIGRCAVVYTVHDPPTAVRCSFSTGSRPSDFSHP